MPTDEKPTYANLQAALRTADLWLKTLVEKLDLDPDETRYSVTVQPSGGVAAETSLATCLNRNRRLLEQTAPASYPTREEAAAAATILLRCNGHDLSTWTDDLWPDDTSHEAMKLLQAHGA